MKDDDHVAIVEKMDVPEFVTKKCQESFSTQDELAICKRNAMAGLSLGNLFCVYFSHRIDDNGTLCYQ